MLKAREFKEPTRREWLRAYAVYLLALLRAAGGGGGTVDIELIKLARSQKAVTKLAVDLDHFALRVSLYLDREGYGLKIIPMGIFIGKVKLEKSGILAENG